MRLRRRVHATPLPAPDHRTEVLLDKMDDFLAEMRVVADQVKAALEEKAKADDDRS